MIEYDESEYQECAVPRQTYALTELRLGRTVADRFLYKPPDGVKQHDKSTVLVMGRTGEHQLSGRGGGSSQTGNPVSIQTSEAG